MFVSHEFVETHNATVKTLYQKIVECRNSTFQLDILDIHGQSYDTVYSMSKFSFGIHGYLIFCALNSLDSIKLASHIIQMINEITEPKFPKILVGNKRDLTE